MSQRQILLAILAILGLAASAAPVRAAALVSQSEARRSGLTRAWYTQIGAPRATGPVNHLHYSDGMLLVQTVGGMLAGVDAETGRTLWNAQVGPRGRSTTTAAANTDQVAAINGSTLYVLERATGKELWHRRVSGVPGAGPTMSATHVFVPMIDGKMEGYLLSAGAKQTPWIYKSSGRVDTPAMYTGQTVSWTTDKGFFYVVDPQATGVRYRLETRDAIHAPPGYWTPNLYAGSTDGYVYAVDEVNGGINWKYSVGDAIYEQPVAVGSKVFVVSQFRGMTCLSTEPVGELWVAPGIKQLLSVGTTRVYARDSVGRLVVLDIETGARLASLSLEDVSVTLTNSYSDRIYLVSAGGALQCLHELGAKRPVMHTPPPPAKVEGPKVKLRDRRDAPADEPLGDEPDADAPAMEDDKPADDAEPPAGDVPASDDPFATPTADEPADAPAAEPKPDAPADAPKSDDPFATP
jgi:outer membrane protein assembly factor BamB